MSPWRLFFAVALPGMISMFTMSIYSILEGVFIGRILGEAALAAVNIALPLVLINFSLSDLIGVGSSAPISVALGKHEEDKADNIFTCAMLMILAVSIVMGIFMLVAAEPLVRLMGADETVVETATKYIRVYALTSPLTTVFFSMDNYLRICGYVKTSMAINIASNFATIGLIAVFLIVLESDVSGAAAASCISMCLCSILALVPFFRGKAQLRFVRPHFTLSLVWQIIACGAPTFLNTIADRVTSVLINISLMTLGARELGDGGSTTAVAIYAVLMYSGDICRPLIYGMSDGIAPSLGFNKGAGKHERVRSIARCGFIGAFVVSALGAAAMYFAADAIAAMFIGRDEVQTLALAVHALRRYSFAWLLRWFTISAQSFLSAVEKPLHATLMSVGVALVFPVLSLGLLWRAGLDGIWMNLFATSAAAAVAGVFLIRSAMREKE